MSLKSILAFGAIAAWGIGLTGQAIAAPKGPAVTDPAKADDDFTLQGEYWGQIALPGWTSGWMGLQVVAQGEGRFDGRLYEGGLPGAGWNRTKSESFSGLVTDQGLIFSTSSDGGQPLTIAVDGRAATFSQEPTSYDLSTTPVSTAASAPASPATLGSLRRVKRLSPLLGLAPTPGARVLLADGVADGLEKAKIEADGTMGIGAVTKDKYGDFRLHVEFRLPYAPANTGQNRGNSGCYLQRRYEVQILDSFGLKPEFNDCGSLYRQRPPEINMCFPPLVWQTYDIYFTAARFDDEGNKTASARLTVVHNGETIHNDVAIPAKTGAGQAEGPEPGPILFQDHGDPVRFRNIWIDTTENYLADRERVQRALVDGGFTPKL